MQKELRSLARRVFVRSFIEALGAPSMLYTVNIMPDIPFLEPLKMPEISAQAALASDWRKVGKDIDDVIDRHAQTIATAEK